jgi:hypothetical protein
MAHSSVASKNDKKNCKVMIPKETSWGEKLRSASNNQTQSRKCKLLHVFECCNERFVQDVQAPLKPIKLEKADQSNSDVEERHAATNV